MSRAKLNNNPVNLRYAGQKGATHADDKGFAIFDTPSAGWRAAHNQIKKDQGRGLSIREFIFKFAPPNENDTNSYLEFICKELNVSPEDSLKSVSVYALAAVMGQMEGYFREE